MGPEVHRFHIRRRSPGSVEAEEERKEEKQRVVRQTDTDDGIRSRLLYSWKQFYCCVPSGKDPVGATSVAR